MLAAMLCACAAPTSQDGDASSAGSKDAGSSAVGSPVKAMVKNEAALYDGYLFWHSADEIADDVVNNTYLTDASGNLIHTWPTELTGGGTPAYLLEGGRVVRTGVRDMEFSRKGPVVSADTIQVVDLNGSIVWEASAKDLGDFHFHHDIEPMPNGNFLVLTYHPIAADEARAIGWDPGDAERIWSDGVIEIKPDYDSGEAEIVWSWKVADHLIQDRFPDAPNYGVVADNPHKIDPHFPKSYAPTKVIRQHINSVDYNEKLDQIALSVFIYNEVWIIDHGTTSAEASTSEGGRVGMGGDLLFRVGNPEAYDRGGPDDRIFLKQHDANWIDRGLSGAGDLIVHNNNAVLKPRAAQFTSENPIPGNRITEEGISQIIQLQLPVRSDGTYERESGRPFSAERTWFWESPEYFAAFQGGARRLPNKSTLLTDTEGRLAIEVSDTGEIVAEYEGAAPSFKAFKYSREDVAAVLEHQR